MAFNFVLGVDPPVGEGDDGADDEGFEDEEANDALLEGACVFCHGYLDGEKPEALITTPDGDAHRLCVSCVLCDSSFADYPGWSYDQEMADLPFCPVCSPLARAHNDLKELCQSNSIVPKHIGSLLTPSHFVLPAEGLSAAQRRRIIAANSLLRLCKRAENTFNVESKAPATARAGIKRALKAIRLVVEKAASKLLDFARVYNNSLCDFVGVIPADLSKYIFSLLDHVSLCRCMRVSKGWKSFATDDRVVWKAAYERVFGKGTASPSDLYRKAFAACWQSVGPILDEDRVIYGSKFENLIPQLSYQLPARPKMALGSKRESKQLPRGFSQHPSKAAAFQDGILSLPDFAITVDLYSYIEEYLNISHAFSPLTEVLRKPQAADAIIQRYYRFMQLKAKYPDQLFVPTEDIVCVWLAHLCQPQQYIDDCRKHFGHTIDFSVQPVNGLWPQMLPVALRMECLWKEEYKCGYFWTPVSISLRSYVGKVHEAYTSGTVFGTEESYRYFCTALNCFMPFMDSDEPYKTEDVDSLRNFLVAQYDPDFRCPLQITADDVMRDRDFSDCFAMVSKYTIPEELGNDPRFREALITEPQFSAIAAKMYEKWLYLQALHPEKELETTTVIDQAMRAHMAHPLNYAADCKRLFGRVISRNPRPGRAAMRQFEETALLWKEEYGADMLIDPYLSPLNETTDLTKYNDLLRDFLEEIPKAYIASVFSVRVRFKTVQDATAANCCTIEATGFTFQRQNVFHCQTCNMRNEEAACVVCARECHAGHVTVALQDEEFFCDCGLSDRCRARK